MLTRCLLCVCAVDSIELLNQHQNVIKSDKTTAKWCNLECCQFGIVFICRSFLFCFFVCLAAGFFPSKSTIFTFLRIAFEHFCFTFPLTVRFFAALFALKGD